MLAVMEPADKQKDQDKQRLEELNDTNPPWKVWKDCVGIPHPAVTTAASTMTQVA